MMCYLAPKGNELLSKGNMGGTYISLNGTNHSKRLYDILKWIRPEYKKKRGFARAHMRFWGRLFCCKAIMVKLCHNTLGQRHGTYNTRSELLSKELG